MIKKCKQCNKEFKTFPSRKNNYFCSIKCAMKDKDIIKKISDARKKNNPGGFKKKKNKLTISPKEYDAIHHWIIRNFEKSNTCEKCGRTGLSGKYINWANKNGIYDKKRENWLRLCRKCHYWYDL